MVLRLRWGFLSPSGSESERNVEDGDRVVVDIEEEDVSGAEEPERQVEQVLPQLYLPELDMNITEIEGLSFNHEGGVQ